MSAAAPQLLTIPTQPEIDKVAEEYQSLETDCKEAKANLNASRTRWTIRPTN